MNVRRTLAISRRIADLFRRDHRTLALVFVAPIVIMALLGWVIRDQAPPTTRVAVVNLAGSGGELAAGAIETAAGDADLVLVEGVGDDAAARTALREGELDIALELSLDAGAPHVLLITPGVNPADDSGRIAELREALATALGAGGPVIEHEAIYGAADGDFFDVFAPALVGFVVFFLVFILTGISFLRERIGGTLERLLATPVRRVEIVVGYSFGFAIFATLQVALVLAFVLGSVHIDSIGPLPEINVGLGVAIAGSPYLAFV
ncbi:MAG TPA: ABC transporter permease, partial [Candidatus Limnocylindrales bacterium]